MSPSTYNILIKTSGRILQFELKLNQAVFFFVFFSFCKGLSSSGTITKLSPLSQRRVANGTLLYHAMVTTFSDHSPVDSRHEATPDYIQRDLGWRGTVSFIAETQTLGRDLRDVSRIQHRMRQERGYYASAHTYPHQTIDGMPARESHHV